MYGCMSVPICGISSSGRAPPCQGGGSEFEPRIPLHIRHHRQEVRQRSAKSLSPVRFWVVPPKAVSFFTDSFYIPRGGFAFCQFASVAQSVEQGTENPRVIGSIPIGGTKGGCTVVCPSQYAELAHLVERHLAKVEVASSSLVFRSMSV